MHNNEVCNIFSNSKFLFSAIYLSLFVSNALRNISFIIFKQFSLFNDFIFETKISVKIFKALFFVSILESLFISTK